MRFREEVQVSDRDVFLGSEHWFHSNAKSKVVFDEIKVVIFGGLRTSLMLEIHSQKLGVFLRAAEGLCYD